MSSFRIARRYARGLFDLEKNDLPLAKSHARMLSVFKELFAERDAGKVLRSPVMPIELKRELLAYGLKQAGADTTVANLINTILESDRVSAIPEVADAFQQYIDEAEGLVHGEVVSAVLLADADLEAIGQHVGRILKKRVQVTPKIDPSLLGGFVASVGNFRIDMSLKSKLDGLSHAAAQDSLR